MTARPTTPDLDAQAEALLRRIADAKCDAINAAGGADLETAAREIERLERQLLALDGQP